jgi:CBS domain-containing protein
LMLEHRFASLPVLGTDGHLLGIVTDTDFLIAARGMFTPG